MNKNIIQYQGKEYRIDYVHEKLEDGAAIRGEVTGEKLLIKATTLARLREPGKDGKIIEFAEANCSNKDEYNKHIGREISRGRLLKKLGIK